MTLLAVDTSHTSGSLALASGDAQSGSLTPIDQRSWRKQAMHSEVATLELQSMFKESGRSLDQLTHLAVNIGPGSFTGLRVGINLSRTLAYLLNKPVYCFNTLEILAFKNHSPNEKVFVAVRAIQNYFYGAAYQWQGDTQQELLAPTSLEDPKTQAAALNCTKVLVEGHSQGLDTQTSATDLVQMLGSCFAKRPLFSWQNVKPLYVRGSEAEEKLKRGIIKSL